MAVGPSKPSELDEFLSRAVDRQMAEQRALREALNDLRRAIESLATQPEQTYDDRRVLQELAQLRADVAGIRPAAPQSVDVDLGAVSEEFTTINANIDGIAQALIDLNAGLRDWANGVDEGITSLVRAVTDVRAIADEARQAAIAANDSLALEIDDRPDESDAYRDERLDEVEARIEETGRLAMAIRDRLDEFERIATAMRQLPKAVEGTVAQVMRRAMAARAKLDKEAEAAMDETLGVLDEQIEALNEAVAGVSGDQLRKVQLAQVDMSSRIDSLQDAFLSRLDAIEKGQEALARAIDRAAVGRETRAAETVRKAAPRAKPAPAVRKPTPKRRSAPKPDAGER